MKKISNEGYGKLPQIVEETIKQTIETKNFDFGSFLQRMEKEFARLGFREPPIRGGVQKILLLRLDAVGDFILTSPAIRAIRENFPRAHITLVVTKAVYPMAEFCPYVNEVIAFEMTHKSSLTNKNFLEILTTALEFSSLHFLKMHYDLCFTFLYDKMHYLMAYMSGARERVGSIVNDPLGNIFLTKPVPIDYAKVAHWCEKNLYIVHACGLKIKSVETELWYDSKDYFQAKNLLGDFAHNKLKIAFGLGANTANRKYPVEKYLVALKEIINKGAAIILLGGPPEIDDAKFIEENLPKDSVKNIAQFQPNWRVTAGIISQTDMYLGNDTGTQHIAAALKKPVIVLTRESKDRLRARGPYCEHVMFAAWQTKSIVLMPDHLMGECAKSLLSPCEADISHCITQIKPEEIVAAFDEMKKFVKGG